MNQDGRGSTSQTMRSTFGRGSTADEARSSAARRGAAAIGGVPIGGYGAITQENETDDGVQGRDADGGRHQQEEEDTQRDPWILEQYLHPPPQGSTDKWEVGLLQQGWLVRHHKKSRKRLFVPVHQSIPIDPTTLGTERITVRVFSTGARVVTLDDWRTSTRTSDNREWRGYTFFKLININPQNEEEIRRSRSTSGQNQVDEEEAPNNRRRNQTSTEDTQNCSNQTSSYEGVWRSGQEQQYESQSDSMPHRFGSGQIPPIEVNVTVNNYTSGSATTSRRGISEEHQMPHGPIFGQRSSEDDGDVSSYSFVEFPETRT